MLDFTTGIGVTNTGHCHPRVVRAIQEQAARLVHGQQNVFAANLPLARLCDRLAKVTPTGLDMFLFVNSGSEAVENAVKVARAHTGRQNVVAFQGGYHGRTYGAMALTSSKSVYGVGFGPLMPGVRTTYYPDCLHCPGGGKGRRAGGECCGWWHEQLLWTLKTQTDPSDTAAVIVEPVLGEGGFLTPPAGFFDALRRVCDDRGILLIVDEVQSGAGRTGHWWAHQGLMSEHLRPDIMVFAKGIASGMPLGGIAARPELFAKCPPASLGGTYGGNPVAAAAAVATIDAIEEDGMIENARAMGERLAEGLREVQRQCGDALLDVRGRGLMMAVEFGAGHPGIAGRVARAAAERGVLLMTAGARDIIRFLPPLNVTAAEVDAAVAAFGEAVRDSVLREELSHGTPGVL